MRSSTNGAATSRPDSLLPFIGSLQLADSYFPSGLYTLSHGLESYEQEHLLNAETLPGIVSDLVRYSVGPSDAIAVACAHRGCDEGDLGLIERADLRLTAVKIAREPRDASMRIGRQVLSMADEIFPGTMISSYSTAVRQRKLPGNHAIALGLIMATLEVPRLEAVAGELYSFVASCAGAALRMSVIDHRQVQRTINELKPVIATVSREALNRHVDDIAGSVPFAEVMTMRHETSDVRLFVS